MEELTKEQQQTFTDLQKPIMSLVDSFYETPAELQEVFADMVSIYEANPTKEVADALSDKVMGKDSAEDKKKWLKDEAAKVPSDIREATRDKYIVGQSAVPKGVPTSGHLLVGLGIVSRGEKDTLLEAQAAARLISHVKVLDAYEPKDNYQNKDGTFENPNLDKPFATQMQRLEHLCNVIVNDIYTRCHKERDREIKGGMPEVLLSSATERTKKEVANNEFLKKAYNEALKTLTVCSVHLKEKNPAASEQIGALAQVLGGGKDTREQLTVKDYEKLMDYADGHMAASMIVHRASQIIKMKQQPNPMMGKER